MPRTDDKKHTNHFYQRVDEIALHILKNPHYLNLKRASELTTWVMEQFGIEKRTAHRYIEEARRQVRAIGKEKTQKAFKRAMQDREYLVREAVRTGDLKVALWTMQDRDKLQGLYVEKVHHTGEINEKITIIDNVKDTE